jgi:hypothetical protein
MFYPVFIWNIQKCLDEEYLFDESLLFGILAESKLESGGYILERTHTKANIHATFLAIQMAEVTERIEKERILDFVYGSADEYGFAYTTRTSPNLMNDMYIPDFRSTYEALSIIKKLS